MIIVNRCSIAQDVRITTHQSRVYTVQRSSRLRGTSGSALSGVTVAYGYSLTYFHMLVLWKHSIKVAKEFEKLVGSLRTLLRYVLDLTCESIPQRVHEHSDPY